MQTVTLDKREKKNDVICIIGMHRSGTSMVARLLNLCGLDLGPSEELMKPNEGNPLGYFENVNFSYKIDDALLAHLGGSWDNPPILDRGWEYDPSLEQLALEAKVLIKTFFNSSKWGWKDPRTTILLPFWKLVIPNLRFVICVRSPLEVAKSLAIRDKMPIEKSAHLWNIYTRTAIRDTQGSRRIFIFYEDFFIRPRKEIERLVKFCGLKKPVNPTVLYETISADLKHHTCESTELLDDNKVSNEHKLLYIALRALKNDHFLNSRTSPSPDDLISESISRISEIFDGFHNETEMTRLQCEYGLLKGKIVEKDQTIVEKDQTIEVLRESLYDKDLKLAWKNEVIHHKDQVIHDKDKAIHDVIHDKDQVIHDKDQAIHDKDQAIHDKDQVIENLATENERNNQFIRVVNNSLAWSLRNKVYGMENKLMPPRTYRRKIYDHLWEVPKQIIFKGASAPKLEAENKLETFKISDPRPKTDELPVEPPLTFKVIDAPIVSIIIPAYNNSPYTYNCLKSIKQNTPPDLYEIIIVDDKSTDNTKIMLKKIKNVRVIYNTDNLGFLRSCNIGAKVAKGKYIILFNNDTEVTEGWLTKLLSIFDNCENVGVVGPKLVYPNGKLQEAGGIVWRDGTAWNYGNMDDPSKPEYNYVKEVDYCSAACLMIRTDVLKKAGPFDERYVPIYYEDTDLAFTIRNKGYKVLYQPQAEIIHKEGLTSGTDTTKGLKRFQEINRTKFFEKWHDILEKNHYSTPISVSDPILLKARERNVKKRILMIDHYVPEFDKDSGSLRIYEYIKIFLKLGLKITFFPDNRIPSSPYTQILQQLGVEVIYGTVDFGSYIEKFGELFYLAFLSRPHVAIKYLDKLKPHRNIYIVYDTVDLGFIRLKRQAEIEWNPKLWTQADDLKKTELELSAKSDMTIVVSELEKNALHHENKLLNIKTIPHVHRVEPFIPGHRERYNLIFIGGFSHTPNVDGILWFVNDILPVIKKRIPDIRLYVIGSNPPNEISSLNSDRIIVTGYIREVSTFFKSCRVFVAPLRYGAGIKGKILHSMSYGVPVVTTDIGAEGMDLIDGETTLIARTEHEFAEKVIQVYKDEKLWEKLSINSVEYVKTNHSPESCQRTIEKVFSKFLDSSHSP